MTIQAVPHIYIFSHSLLNFSCCFYFYFISPSVSRRTQNKPVIEPTIEKAVEEKKSLGVDGLTVPGDAGLSGGDNSLSLDDDDERRIHFTFSGADAKARLLPDHSEIDEISV